MKTYLAEKYQDLENEVIEKLKTLIKQSTIKSKHVNTPAIKTNTWKNLFNNYVSFDELIIWDDKLIAVKFDGLQFNPLSLISLEELIDVYDKISGHSNQDDVIIKDQEGCKYG